MAGRVPAIRVLHEGELKRAAPRPGGYLFARS